LGIVAAMTSTNFGTIAVFRLFRPEFDNIELASITDLALTTVHVPHTKMGRQAAKTLVGVLNGETPGKSTELITNLCLHKSLGEVPKD